MDSWILTDNEDDLLEARRIATSIAADLNKRRFGESDDRYVFEVLVESVESAVNHGEVDNGTTEILAERVVIEASEVSMRVNDVVPGSADLTEALASE